jgi:hypothetical protein
VLQKQHVINSIERQGEQGFFDPKQERGSSGRGGKSVGEGRGGRGGGRGRSATKFGPKPASNTAKPTSKKEDKDGEMELDPKGGVKRKREQFEPDGAIGTGDREGGGPPAVAHTAKKAKVEYTPPFYFPVVSSAFQLVPIVPDATRHSCDPASPFN